MGVWWAERDKNHTYWLVIHFISFLLLPFFWVRSIVVLLISIYILFNLYAMDSWSVIILTNYIFILTFYSRKERTMVKRLGIGLAGSPAGRGTFCGIPQIKRTSLSTIVSSCPYELMKFRTMLGITILLRYFVILYLVSVYILGYLKAPKFWFCKIHIWD